MKLLTQGRLSKLENYFCVSKVIKKKVDFWTLCYAAFISLYIFLWIEKSVTNQYVTIGVLLTLVFSSYYIRKFPVRLMLIFLLILLNPLLTSLLYPIDDKKIRLIILSAVFLFTVFAKIESLIKTAGIMLAANIVFCFSLIVAYYSLDFNISVVKNSPSISSVIGNEDASKDIYVVILDGFPDKEIIKKYFNGESSFIKFLKDKGFEERQSLSRYTETIYSLPNIFSGSIFSGKSYYKTKDIEQMHELLPGKYLKDFVRENGHRLIFNSFILNNKLNGTRKAFGRGTDFSVYFFSLVDKLEESFFPLSNNTNKDTDEINRQGVEAIKAISGGKGKALTVQHFMTFHHAYFTGSPIERFNKNLRYADELGIEVVKTILEKKPKAKIIVLSDHGERGAGVSEKDSYKGILYVKN